MTVALTLIFGGSSLRALEGYHSYEKMTDELQALSAQYKNLINMTSLVTTTEDRQIWLVTLGTGSVDDKPALALVAGVEGDEVASGEICLKFLNYVCSAYGEEDSVTTFLDQYTFYILPRINPDASEQLWEKPSYDRQLNANAVDLDVDGFTSEDGYEDLNGDSWITWMRVQDPAGEWIADPQCSDLMRKLEPGDNATPTYDLLWEGVDNDGDGCWNEDPQGGINLDQNFSYNFRPFTGGGPHPMSECESRALADFFFAHPNVAMVFTFSHNENLLHPWEKASKPKIEEKPLDGVLKEDISYFSTVAQKFQDITNFQKNIPALRNGGNLAEWAYYHYGRWSFAAPAWIPSVPDSLTENKDKDPLAAQRQLYLWLKESRLESLFIPWSKIKHLDFPGSLVEVGGFVPGIQKNPPADSLESLSNSYGKFFLYLGTLLPKLTLHPKVENTAPGIYRITLVIRNEGLLSTHTQIGAHLTWAKKIKAELLTSPHQQRLSGNRFYLTNRIDSGKAVTYEWLISASAGSKITLEVSCPTTGRVDTTLTLD